MVTDTTEKSNNQPAARVGLSPRVLAERQRQWDKEDRNREIALEKYGRLQPDDEEDTAPDMLIGGVLAADAPGVVSNREKGHKTSLLMEIALLLSAKERPPCFLGYDAFEVCRWNMPVVYLAYEGTEWERKDLIRRIARARGIQVNWRKLHVLTGRLPRLNTSEGIDEYNHILDQGLFDGLAIIDPLNQALAGSDFSRAAVIGGHLMDSYEVARDHGMTPLYAHHHKQARAVGLDALAGAGLEQHLGQWLLGAKIGPYDAARGHQQYKIEVGARCGFGGKYRLDVVEGHLNDRGGRHWATTVQPMTSATDGSAASNPLTEAVLAAVAESAAITRTGIKQAIKRNPKDIKRALDALVADGRVVEVEVTRRGNVTTGYATPNAERTPNSSETGSPERLGG